MNVDTDLNDEQVEQLIYIQQQTNQGIADILSHGLDHYYQTLALHEVTEQLLDAFIQGTLPPRKSPLEIFQELSLVGCIKDADPDLSSNYKSLVHQEIEDRYERDQQ